MSSSSIVSEPDMPRTTIASERLCDLSTISDFGIAGTEGMIQELVVLQPTFLSTIGEGKDSILSFLTERQHHLGIRDTVA